MKISKQLQAYIDENLPSEYMANFHKYEPNSLDYSFSDPHNLMLPKLKRDLQRIEVIQQIIKDRKTPLAGDYLKLDSGEIVRIGIATPNNLSISNGISAHISDNGNVSVSGGFRETIEIKENQMVLRVHEMKEANYWFFHNNDVRGGYGANFTLKAPVWVIKNKLK